MHTRRLRHRENRDARHFRAIRIAEHDLPDITARANVRAKSRLSEQAGGNVGTVAKRAIALEQRNDLKRSVLERSAGACEHEQSEDLIRPFRAGKDRGRYGRLTAEHAERSHRIEGRDDVGTLRTERARARKDRGASVQLAREPRIAFCHRTCGEQRQLWFDRRHHLIECLDHAIAMPSPLKRNQVKAEEGLYRGGPAVGECKLAIYFLRESNHLEIESERANHIDGVLAAQLIEHPIDLAFVDARLVGTPHAREGAQPLDVVACPRASHDCKTSPTGRPIKVMRARSDSPVVGSMMPRSARS